MKKITTLLAAVGLVALIALAGCTSGDNKPEPAPEPTPAPAPAPAPDPAPQNAGIACKIETLVPQSGDLVKYYTHGVMDLDGKTFEIPFIAWTDDEGKVLTVDDKFDLDHTYTALLYIPSAGKTLITDPSKYDFQLRDGFSFKSLGAGNEGFLKLVLEVTCAPVNIDGNHTHNMKLDAPVSLGPSCFDGGYNVYGCQECDARDYEDVAMIGAHKVPANTAVTKAATCTEAGVRSYTCERCGGHIDEPIPAFGHHWTRYGGDAPDCTHEGHKAYRCMDCNATKDEVVPAIGHDWSRCGVTEPTCTEEGIIKYECSHCGEEKREGIPATGHNWVSVADKPATCTEQSEHIFECQNAGCTETKTEYGPANGHQWERVSGGSPATCIHDGFKPYHCPVCGDDYNEIIPASPQYHYFIYKPYDEQRHVRACQECGLVDVMTDDEGYGGHVGEPGGNCELCGYALPEV